MQEYRTSDIIAAIADAQGIDTLSAQECLSKALPQL